MGASTEFEEFVRDVGDDLLRYATVVTASPELAADVVQSVLERAYRRWDRIGALDAPRAYLRRMIVNEFVSVRRRVVRLTITDRVPERASEDHADRYGAYHTLIAEIRKLPPRQRAAVGLRYWHDLSDADIAEQLGCTESTVRGYVFRALRRLRVELTEADASAVTDDGRPA